MSTRVVSVARLLTACAIVLLLAPVLRADASDAVLYRVFLRDGSALVSYGEFARVADRVVLSIPIGEGPTPLLQLVTIAESAVDWERTDRYAEAARARQYADTRGESDFTLLSSEVARVLNEVALSSDPAKRLALATEARRVLAQWPSQHYGYRASDVAQLSAWLDEVVSELRAAAGQSRFDLSFTATTAAPPAEQLLGAPTLRESIELAFAAARITPEPSERISLLRAVETALGSLDGRQGQNGPQRNRTPDPAWAAALRTRAAKEISSEVEIGRTYADLSSRLLADADRRARRADVRGVEDIIKKAAAEDAKLGRVRPHEAAALLAALDAKLNAARRLRLARDAWSARLNVLKEYRGKVKFAFDQFHRSKSSLNDIRQLAGPSSGALSRMAERVTAGYHDLALIKAPSEVEKAHALIGSALHMAGRAADARRKAMTSGDLKTAWDASAAAAGALMLYEQALQELERVVTIPELRD